MKPENKDVVIAGGSISGLLCARELSQNNHNITILEEHDKIGVPEKCDGLISVNALSSLGVIPNKKTIQNKITGARFFSPSGKLIDIDSSNLDIIVLDRKEFDNELSEIAIHNGAQLMKSTSFIKTNYNNSKIIVHSSQNQYHCKYFVDAMGISSLMKKQKFGVLQAAKYIIEADWFESNKVDLYFNQQLSPGFFTWVIPINERLAKVGIAGYGINSFNNLDYFLKNKKHKVIKKIACRIIVSGAIQKFVQNNVVSIGDSAAQTKPTTAGGIFSGGLAGIFAGQSIDNSLRTDTNLLHIYENRWRDVFGSDFASTRLFRKIFDNLENNHLESIFDILSSSSDLQDFIHNSGDFDFHSFTLLKALGLKRLTKLFNVVSSSEIKKLIHN